MWSSGLKSYYKNQLLSRLKHENSVNKKRSKETEIEEIAKRAHAGEDVSSHFTGRHLAKQRISLDLPLRFLRLIDEECKRMGITREAWIKMACDERLRQAEGRDLAKVS